MENLEGDCDQCILQSNGNCSKKDLNKVKICKTLKNRQRVKYAHKNGLLKISIEGHFTQMFWRFHDPIDLAIPLLYLGDANYKKEKIHNSQAGFLLLKII